MTQVSQKRPRAVVSHDPNPRPKKPKLTPCILEATDEVLNTLLEDFGVDRKQHLGPQRLNCCLSLATRQGNADLCRALLQHQERRQSSKSTYSDRPRSSHSDPATRQVNSATPAQPKASYFRSSSSSCPTTSYATDRYTGPSLRQRQR